jgi:hypothetical protein
MSLLKHPRTGFALALLGVALVAPRAGYAACTVSVGNSDTNGTPDLRLVGDTYGQTAIIELRGIGGWKVTCAGVVSTGTQNIETYVIALGGNDTVTVLQTEDLVGDSKNIVFSEPAGGNRFTYQSQGFAIRDHSSLVFELRGGAGNDNVKLDFLGATVDTSMVLVRGDLGGGTNIAAFVGAAVTRNALVDVDIKGGIAYNDGGGLVSNSTVNVRMNAADDYYSGDVISATFSGQVEDGSRVYLKADLLRGQDKFWGNFDVSRFSIDAAGTGGSEVSLLAKGGNGADVLKISDLSDQGITGVAAVNGLLSIDLEGGNQPDALGLVWHGLTGTGEFRYRAAGENAYDQLNATFATDPTSANLLSFLLLGNTERDFSPAVFDTITANVTDNGTASYGALGEVILDGGLQGDDTCNFTGNAPHVALMCEKGTR